jgi:hypothetical protein
MAHQIARAANTPEDFRRWGVTPGTVQPWEDGMRTKPADKSFEWWYLDASLADGSSVVLTFMTKDTMNFGTKLAPWVSLEITDANGKTTTHRVDAEASEFSAATDHCDVHIGKNYVTGDLHRYAVHFENSDIVADFTFDNLLTSWRPGAGANIFGDHYFAWLPAVPAAHVHARIAHNGATGQAVELEGNGYHDHNWGDASMLKLMHHWYWGRAAVGDYRIISTETTAEKAFGYQKLPVMMISDHGTMISGDESNMSVEDSDTIRDPATGKPVQQTLRYRVTTPAASYVVTYETKRTISGFKMVDQLSGIKKFLATLSGFDGAYLRFTGAITVEKFVSEKLVDRQVNPDGIWELMYFGKTLEE